MTFNFIIPGKNAELLETSGNNYCVSRVLEAREISQKLKGKLGLPSFLLWPHSMFLSDARVALREAGILFIFDHFDSFFSIIELTAKEIGAPLSIRGLDILYDAIDKLGHELASNLHEIASGVRLDLLNATKMLLYLQINTIRSIDAVHEAKGAGGKKSANDGDLFEWDGKRQACLLQIFNISQLPVEQLYDPPVLEEQLTNLICDLSYRTLQLGCVKEKRTAEVSFQILGTAIKRFNHSMTFPVKLMKVLGEKDFSIRPCAEGLFNILHEEFKITKIFDALKKELIEQMVDHSHDTKLARHYSQFLVDLTLVAPGLVMPHLLDISDTLLDCENHTVRNSVLQIMCEIVETELRGEDLEEESKEIRDECLDMLFEHTQDISAHVRAKVLALWMALKEKGAIPLSRNNILLKRAVERLEDKSSIVRKAAASLICSFLSYNPFSAKLSLDQLETEYQAEEKRLEELRKKQAELLPQIEKVEQDWEAMATDIQTVIINEVNSEIAEAPNGLRDIGMDVVALLREEKYKDALMLVRRGDTANAAEVALLSFEDKCKYHLALLKSYHTIANRPADYSEEIAVLSDTLQFQFERIEFSKTITDAVPLLKLMIMSKTNSDVHESIRFFTTAYLFEVQGCDSGMQHMIYLVWSPDKEKREVVNSAFREVLFTTDLKDRAHNVRVVGNLCRFLEKLNVGQYAAFEVLMKEWVEQEVIDHQMIQVSGIFFCVNL